MNKTPFDNNPFIVEEKYDNGDWWTTWSEMSFYNSLKEAKKQVARFKKGNRESGLSKFFKYRITQLVKKIYK